MIRNRITSFALAAIVAGASHVPPAMAAKFDGSWSMVAVTARGDCGVIPMGLEIRRGRIQSTGGSFAL